ncbi:MAG: hypothetical protein BM555_03335 [Crocinitomix sp. MedPE-SWsnd]|nr:MAG: hypothetical protein BM555_03335 [Crocinitomix sp. MedPE-SWsnd]
MIYLIKTNNGEVPSSAVEVAVLVEDKVIPNKENYSVNEIEGAKKVIFVSNQAELLNAELEKPSAIVWKAPFSNELENIIAQKPKYGWQLQSLNTPLFVSVNSLEEFKSFKSIAYRGIYSNNLALLIEISNLIENE